MASEIKFDAGPGLTGITAYAMLRNAAGQVYNTAGSAFENYNAANITDYDLALTEQGVIGFFMGDMPAVASGLYSVTIKQRAGGSPAVADVRIGGGEILWTGTSVNGSAGREEVNATHINGTSIAGIGSRIADAFVTMFNVATPVFNMSSAIQTGDSFLRIGNAGASLTAIGDTRLGNLDMAVSTRMATYVQPAGFLAATFPSDPADQSLIITATNALATLIDNLPTNAELATALGTADDAVLAQVALVKADTAAIKLKTDQLVFTVSNALNVNVRYVNDSAIDGAGTSLDPWGPA